MKKLLIGFGMLLIVQMSMAHKKRYGNVKTNHSDHIWNVEDRTIVAKGSFLLVNDEVSGEREDKIAAFLIDEQLPKDQEYITGKTEHISSLNQPGVKASGSRGPGILSLLLLIGILFCMVFLTLVTVRSFKRQEAGLWLSPGDSWFSI